MLYAHAFHYHVGDSLQYHVSPGSHERFTSSLRGLQTYLLGHRAMCTSCCNVFPSRGRNVSCVAQTRAGTDNNWLFVNAERWMMSWDFSYFRSYRLGGVPDSSDSSTVLPEGELTPHCVGPWVVVSLLGRRRSCEEHRSCPSRRAYPPAIVGEPRRKKQTEANGAQPGARLGPEPLPYPTPDPIDDASRLAAARPTVRKFGHRRSIAASPSQQARPTNSAVGDKPSSPPQAAIVAL